METKQFEFECGVCGKTFSSPGRLSRHVTMSRKNHPKLQYYYQKYPIDDKLKDEYDRQRKSKRKETHVVDKSKIGDVELDRGYSDYEKVAKHGLSNIHILIAINATECNKQFVNRIPALFNSCNVHMCVMGPGARNIGADITDKVNTFMALDSVIYNYSFAINVLLKQVADKLPLSTVVISDGWSIFSIIQIIKEFKSVDLDWENNFVVVKSSYEYRDDPLDLTMPNKLLVQHTMQRLKTHRDPDTAIPLVVCKTKHIVDMENGLEEEFFSEYSRLHLINQLETAGLAKVESENSALCLKIRKEKDFIEQRDFKTISDIKNCSGYFVFIPSNYKTEWGMADKIGILEIDKNNLPLWRYKIHRPNIRNMYDLNKVEENHVKNIETPWTGRTTNVEVEIDPSNNILLLVNSTVSELLSSTPLIRGLYEKYGEIDILTDDKLNTSNSLIKNYMVRKIYDVNDFKYKMFTLKNYGSNIIKTADCNVDVLDKLTDIIEAPDTCEDLVTRNYSIIDPVANKTPNPYCNFKISNEKIPPDSIAITISATDKNIVKNKIIMDQFGTIGSRLANNINIHILFLVFQDEFKLLETSRFNIRKNIHVYENKSYFHMSGLINKCKLLITSSNSVSSWISWGLKKNTIIMDASENDMIPEGECVDIVEVEDGPKNKTNLSVIDSVINKIYKYL